MGGRDWAARHLRDGHRRDDCPSLTGSNLTGSNLTGSNLTGSNLTGSNLTGSNLTGSNLTGSRLARHWPVGQPKAGPGAVLLHFPFRARQSPSYAVVYSPAGHLRTVDRLPYPR